MQCIRIHAQRVKEAELLLAQEKLAREATLLKIGQFVISKTS